MRHTAPAALFVAALVSVVAPSASAQRTSSTQRAVRAAQSHIHGNGAAVVRELIDLLAIPNVASDSANIRRNANALVRMLERRGAATRILESDGAPAVFGELNVPGARRTVVFYAHYDGQPVVPEDWVSPPWEPVLRAGKIPATIEQVPESGRLHDEWRLYARSASDDKSPIVAMLAAVDALRAAGIQPSVNLKFFFEGEEEDGSPNLRGILERNRSLLAGDVWIIADGPVHVSGLPQVIFGARGVVGVELSVYGPARPLHSGHYGNWATNPGAVIADLVASMRTGDGEVRIAGFYDDVREATSAELAAADSLARFDQSLRESLQLGVTEAGNAPLPRRLLLPALNVRGIRAGAVGSSASNVIPTEAHASLDIRLVPDQRVERVQEIVEAHIRSRGFTITRDVPDSATRMRTPKLVRVRWSSGYPAARTDLNLPVSRRVVQLIEEATGRETLVLPSYGGSLPAFHFNEVLRVPLVFVPMVNADNNQHAANENLRIGNLWLGIEMYAALIARLGDGAF